VATSTETKNLILASLKKRAARAEKDFPSSEGGFKSGLKSAISVVSATRVKDADAQSLVKRDAEGRAISPNFDRISDLRARLSGWHFSKESLSKGEREILYVAEQIMGTLDELCGGFLG
jgi:hypothetical protein